MFTVLVVIPAIPWIFSGIGATVLAAAGSLIYRKLKRSKKKPPLAAISEARAAGSLIAGRDIHIHLTVVNPRRRDD
jgi:hypothetical protein